MPPNTERHESTLNFKKYPTNRDITWKTGDSWLDGKKCDDGAEGLWRIHDNIYDLKDFVHKHPGGSMWLEITQVSNSLSSEHDFKPFVFLGNRYKRSLRVASHHKRTRRTPKKILRA